MRMGLGEALAGPYHCLVIAVRWARLNDSSRFSFRDGLMCVSTLRGVLFSVLMALMVRFSSGVVGMQGESAMVRFWRAAVGGVG